MLIIATKISQLTNISGSQISAGRDFIPIVKWNSPAANTGSNFKVYVSDLFNSCNNLPEITSGFLNSSTFVAVSSGSNTNKLSLVNLFLSSSYTQTSSYSKSSSYATKASSTKTTISSSVATHVLSSNTATSSSYTTRTRSSSYATKAASSNTATSSSYATRSRSSSYVSYAAAATAATSASYATQARSASYATTAKSASYATKAASVLQCNTAISASYAAGGGSGLTANTTVNLNSSMTTAQMQALIDAQPKMLNQYTLTIQFADGTYNLDSSLKFEYFTGDLQILGNAADFTAGTSKNVGLTFSNVVGSYAGALNFKGCVGFTVKGIKISISGTSNPNAIRVGYGSVGEIYYNYFIRPDGSVTASSSGHLVLVHTNSTAQIESNYFSAAQVAITSYLAAKIISANNASSPNSSTYSTNADAAIVVRRLSGQPAGSILTQEAGGTYT